MPSLRHLMHPLQNLFLGEPNAKRWRREVDAVLKQDAKTPGMTVGKVLKQTLHVVGLYKLNPVDPQLERHPVSTLEPIK